MEVVILEGLNCSSCADKIEQKVKQLPEIKNSFIDFVDSSIKFELDSIEDREKVLKSIKEIVNTYEPHVVVREKEKIEIGRLPAKKSSICTYFIKDYKLIVGIALFVISMFISNPQIKLVLYVGSYLLIGWNVIITAFRNILKREVFDENFLMTIATIGAFAIGEYAEGVAVMFFYKIGELFQDYAVDNSRKSIKDLVNIKASYANKIIKNELIKVSPEDLSVGDIIVVKAGEKVAVDGEVVEGLSWVDTSPITGESVPRKFAIGDMILSGYINNNSVLNVRVTKEYSESTVAKILNLIENASAKKSQTEKFITKFARYYTPVVVFAAMAISFIPPLLMSGQSLGQWVHRGLIFLVISCPCALVVSIPLGYFAGIGAASKEGILIKGGQYLEVLKNINTIVFDKTGTLTKGVFTVNKVFVKNEEDKEFMIECAAKSEALSSHPLATSITRYYEGNIDIKEIDDFEEIGGKGIRANYRGHQVLVGNSKLMSQEGILVDQVDEGGTVSYVAIDNKYYGYLVISDEVKPGIETLVYNLKKQGIKEVVMFTGDQSRVANEIKHKLKIDRVKAELLPQDKVSEFEKLKNNDIKSHIAFVGDGINDAPVLAIADVGISMGALGSDAAIEASDVVLITDEPNKIVEGIKIAKFTNKIVIQNIILALGVKALVLILGAFGLANMWAAIFADVGVALIAILNVTRIYFKK
ncbi:heavy metal translocating P-type ATPase [Alkalibaculum sporogenes]|uniref:heavy metal translocating P-type ATPase n=1 Tax=Alkalibaculum sporogenes TaxID=2655001 RepID=UPI00128DA28A|nr:heavy metal translocating P-type ATPase [Alkalibaculum sporogenes]